MEAKYRWMCAAAMAAGVIFFSAAPVKAANARSQNFLVHAPTQALADAVAKGAEDYRNQLAEYWLGRRLPPWQTPCPVEVVAGPNLAAQGVTQYDRHTGSNFQMKVIGTPERIMDSVLPHEVTHTVLASHFRGPLPRWADEGICTTVEHQAERQKHEIKLREFLQTRRGIAMNKLFLLTEYPSDMLPMYAQGYSVCRFLIQQSGPRQFIEFLTDYTRRPSWTANVQKHYGYESLAELQERWLAWVAQGSGDVEEFVSARTKASKSLASASLASASLASARNSAGGASITPASASNADLAQIDSSRTSSDQNGSWYLRRRQQAATGMTVSEPAVQASQSQTATGQLASVGPPHSESSPSKTELDHRQEDLPQSGYAATVPPSIAASGRYSVSQPQGEQRYGRTSRMYR